MDAPYKVEDVDAELRPVFEQLQARFGDEYEVWTRVDNFGLWVTAGVVNPGRRVVAEVEMRRGTRERTTPLSVLQLRRIRTHLSRGGARPLRIVLSR